MGRWGKWQAIEEIYHDVDLLRKKGLYQIRMVDKENVPISIPRIKGIDSSGILYMGKSIRLRPRIEAFWGGRHSGGGFYYRAYRRLRKYKPYKEHSLQFRVMAVAESDVTVKERSMLQRYFRQFCELPPFNSTVPGGK
jgi:hypothetical protein